MLNRRAWLMNTSAAGIGLRFPAVLKGGSGPSGKVAIGVIGVRGRGQNLAHGFATHPHATVTHVCDVNENLLEPFSRQIGEIQQYKPHCVTDLRRVFDDSSVDAVAIATPDHWHALATIWACQAGKHVYVEKPVSHNIDEARQMVAAASKYKRVVQVGTQSRSVPHYRQAIELIHGGRIGKVHLAKAWNSQLRRRVEAVSDSAVPSGLDWNTWQGPAPERPYNENRYSYGWRWLWDYGTGDMGNDGVHDFDIARWGLDVTAPASANCTAAKLVFVGDSQETPDTQIVAFEYPDSQQMIVYEQRLWSPYHQEGFENGVTFYGTDGYLTIGRKRWTIVESRNQVVLDENVEFSDGPHFDNFIQAIRESKPLNCDIQEGFQSTLLAHLGNVSYRVGRKVQFEAATGAIVGDNEAAALQRRAGRKEFVIPSDV
jgi:predicted dehydrogenase